MKYSNHKINLNFLIQIIGKTLGTILGIIVIGMMTRYLGTRGFGQYTTIMAYLQLFGILVDFGLSLTTTQMISKPNADTPKIMSNVFSFRIISAVLFLGLAPLIVLRFPYEPIVKTGIALTTLSFFFISLLTIFTSIFQKNLDMKKVAIAEIINRVFLLIAVFTAIRCNQGLLGILVAIILSNVLHFTLHYLFSRKYVRIHWEIDFSVWKNIFHKTWPIAVTITFNLIYFKADMLILSIFKSQEEVGIYGAPYKILEVLSTLPYLFSGIILPILTYNWAKNNKARFKEIFQNAFDTMSLITFPMIAGTLILADQIMLFVAGEEFTDSSQVLRMLIFATGIIFIGNLFSHAIVAINQQKKVIPIYIATAILSLAGYLYFIPRYSIYGAAGMTIAAEFTISFLIFLMIYKKTGFKPCFSQWPSLFLASILMMEMLYFWKRFITWEHLTLNLFLQVGVSAIVYFAILAFLGVINQKNIKTWIHPQKTRFTTNP